LEALEDRLAPSVYTVTSTGDTGAGSGLNGDLRYCITQANANAGTNTIQFDSNVFGTPQTIILTSALPTITDNNLTIAGPGASLATVSGNHLYQVLNIPGVNVSLSGLTIANGSAAFGAGIKFVGSGTLSISNSVISGNSAGTAAGGIYFEGPGALTLANTVISSNSSNNLGAGGIYSSTFNPGTVTLTNCTMSRNSSNGNNNNSNGGAIQNRATLTLTNCTLANNFAYHAGGAIFNEGTLTLTDCTLSGNSVTSQFGGAIDATGNPTTLIDCTLSGNSDTTSKGGAIAAGPLTTLTNCTLSGNSAKYGGGIDVLSGSVTQNNTLVAGNTSPSGPDVNGAVSSNSGFNLIGDGTGMTGITNGANGNQVGTSASPINPLLATLGNYGGPTQSLALLPGSPALDAGSNALDGGVSTDQRGDPRVVNGTVDIGAFESQGFTVAVIGGGCAAGTWVGKSGTGVVAWRGAGNPP
jgi:hypothetical protein